MDILLYDAKIRYHWIENYLKDYTELGIENSILYNKLAAFLKNIAPDYKDKFDVKWLNLYLSVRRSGKLVSLPTSVVLYDKRYFFQCNLAHGNGKSISFAKGKKKQDDFYTTLIDELINYTKFINEKGVSVLEKTIPYDIRTGTILGKYVLLKVMYQKVKKELLYKYNEHLKKELTVKEISLNDYLRVAGIGYKAAYPDKSKDLKDEDLYKRFADMRHSGMLDIKNKDSKEEYMDWLYNHSFGGHPFEIVFSWHRHGIHLYPTNPKDGRYYYEIRVTNYAYANDFIKMVEALISQNIPFRAHDFEEVLEYLSGNTIFKVNEYDEHMLHYYASKEDKKAYFKHINWTPIEFVRINKKL